MSKIPTILVSSTVRVKNLLAAPTVKVLEIISPDWAFTVFCNSYSVGLPSPSILNIVTKVGS